MTVSRLPHDTQKGQRMKAVFYTGINNIEIEEKGIPKTTGSDMVVKVKKAAICGTDLRILKNGHFKIPSGEKRVLGHEIVGEIVEVGDNVSHYSPGMRVALVPNIGCGHCDACRAGFNELCPDYEAFGISYDGGFEEYVYVPAHAISEGNVLVLPDQLTYDQAILAEPLSCCYNAYRSLETKPGDVVLIFGAGPIGALHVLLNRFVGASKIISVDISKERLSKMKNYGADTLINSNEEDLDQAIMLHTNGKGADVIITACSVPSLQSQVLKYAAGHGRINYFGGLPEGKSEVLIDTNIMHYKELKIMGTTGSSRLDYINALKIISSGRLNLEGLISRKFKIDEAKEAFEYALSGQGMKTVFDFE